MKYFFVPLLGMFLTSATLMAQESYEKIVAKPGDGIFSVLRNEGINPLKYYTEFIELNKDNLIEGSELHAGREYVLPDAADSFKNMGRLVVLPENTEKTLFEGELSKISVQSDMLKNTVYYLISENQDVNDNTKKFTDDVTKDMAKRLLENGALVYVIRSKSSNVETDKMNTSQGYIDIINKRFLRNSGKYQRLLMVSTNGVINQKRLDISIYHHNNSDDGERFATNIQSVFKKYNNNKIVVENNPEIFVEKEKLFLAKNILPALTLVKIGNQDNGKSSEKVLSVRPDKKALATWLTSGIFKDYADLEIED